MALAHLSLLHSLTAWVTIEVQLCCFDTWFPCVEMGSSRCGKWYMNIHLAHKASQTSYRQCQLGPNIGPNQRRIMEELEEDDEMMATCPSTRLLGRRLCENWMHCSLHRKNGKWRFNFNWNPMLPVPTTYAVFETVFILSDYLCQIEPTLASGILWRLPEKTYNEGAICKSTKKKADTLGINSPL